MKKIMSYYISSSFDLPQPLQGRGVMHRSCSESKYEVSPSGRFRGVKFCENEAFILSRNLKFHS
jgi:hypothetical protein